MTIEEEKLDLRLQRLEAKVFDGSNLNIDKQLEKLTARQKAEQITAGEEPETNLDTDNIKIIQAEIDNISRSMDEDTKKNHPKKYKELEARRNELVTKLRKLLSK